MAEEVYTHKFGTFLGNHDYDRKQLRIPDLTESIWTYVMLERVRFTNRYYNPIATRDIIEEVPLTAPFCFDEWREFFCKWTNKAHNIYFTDMTASGL